MTDKEGRATAARVVASVVVLSGVMMLFVGLFDPWNRWRWDGVVSFTAPELRWMATAVFYIVLGVVWERLARRRES